MPWRLVHAAYSVELDSSNDVIAVFDRDRTIAVVDERKII